MKIGIVGARDRVDGTVWGDICQQLKFAQQRADLIGEDIHIISGGCPTGADAYAIKYAIQHELDYTVYSAKWKKHGKRAGPLRNEIIARKSEVLIAFPNPACKGTQQTIGYFKMYHPDAELIIL